MKKLIVSVLFVCFFACVQNAKALRMPDKVCGELTKFDFKVKGQTLQYTFSLKPKKGCSNLDLQLPQMSSIKVLNSKGIRLGGVYVEKNQQLNTLTIRQGLYWPKNVKMPQAGMLRRSVVFLIKVTNAVQRLDLIAASLKWQKFFKKHNTSTTGVNITGMGGWIGEIDIFIKSRDWNRWAKKQCQKTLLSNHGAKTKHLIYNRAWCLRRYYTQR